jgi:hypothetical protein
MSSPAKVSANRENALKSTGPRSERGKSKSRLNALKFGIHAKFPVLPGEDEGAYQALLKSNMSYFAPDGPVEHLLVRQITAEEWRLRRIEAAENTLPERIVEGKIIQLLGTFNKEEAAYIKSSYGIELIEELGRVQRAQETASRNFQLQHPGLGGFGPPERSGDEIQDGVEASLSRILEPENALHDCLVPQTERAPQTYLVNERRAAARAYLHYVRQLKDLQEDRMTVTQLTKSRPIDVSDLA